MDRNNRVKYPFSTVSLNKLQGVHPKLVDFIFELANLVDLKLVYGVRQDEEQTKLFNEGKSTFDGVTKRSNHQTKEDGYGYAVDALPLPTGVNMYDDNDPENLLRWAQFDGICLALAHKMGLTIRTGFKWRQSAMASLQRNQKENTLPDGNHIEIIL